MPSPSNILCETQEQPRLAEIPDDNDVRYYLNQLLKQSFHSNPTTHKRATIHLASMKYHPTASASVTHFFCFCDAFLLDAKSEVVPSSLRVVFLPHPGGVFFCCFSGVSGARCWRLVKVTSLQRGVSLQTGLKKLTVSPLPHILK